MLESLRRTLTQTGLQRPIAIIFLLLLSSIPLFSDLYYRLLSLATDFDLLSSSGAYPLAMLLILILWLLGNRKQLISTLSIQDSNFCISHYSLLGLLLAAASLALRALIKDLDTIPQLFLLLGFLQGCTMFAFPATSRETLKALSIYIVSASIPSIASTYLESPISLSFTSSVVHLLRALGYPVEQSSSTILLELRSGQVTKLQINSACAGPASYSIFLLLNGLMILDLGVGRRRAVLSTLAGLATLFLLNLLRVTMIVHATYHYGEGAGLSVHLYLGYILFTTFYLVYVLLFIKSTRHKPT
ncbi:MAG: exosortase/archaeosortase family protein [Thermoproteota archaeon]